MAALDSRGSLHASRFRTALTMSGMAVSAVLFAAAAPMAGQEPGDLSAAEMASRSHYYLLPGEPSGLPSVVANDNRARAGGDREGAYQVELEIRRADWRLESEAGPGLRVAAVGEAGGPPMIPAPLLRTRVGATVRATVTNLLENPVTVLGLHDHDGGEERSFELAAGETRVVEWVASSPGTFLYDVQEHVPDEDLPPPALRENGFRTEREQAAGALVVEAPGEPREDRIIVMNVFSQGVFQDGEPIGFMEGLTMNGRSWPYTERIQMEVGTPERWRVVNASRRNHPMHLHGFYFNVLSRGTPEADTLYAPEDERLVVTEFMFARTTMLMEWTPTRPGSWLFHCHLSFHVSDFLRLPGAAEADPEHAHSHMAGLIMGIEVAPGPTDLIAEGPVTEVHLRAVDVPGDDVHEFGFVPGDAESDERQAVPGPLLVFNQYQAADVTVENRMSQPTGIHWHGLELDGWADGVPDWSASDGRMSPVIHPGEAFTYRLSFMRPGSFMYHTHMNDIVQLTGGLYGPLVVLPPGEVFDPARDHIKVVSWNTPRPSGPGSLDLNGGQGDPDATARVGEAHRFRLMHIAPAGRVTGWVTRDGETVPIRLLAKDGADLPSIQQIMSDRVPPIGVGETADFVWVPDAPGEYVVHVGPPSGRFSHDQRFVVTEAASGDGGN